MTDQQIRPENYLVHSILVTIFCCWPLGIPAIVQASKVNTLYAEGDYIGAEKASKAAKKWAIWSAVVALSLLFIYAAILVFVSLNNL